MSQARPEAQAWPIEQKKTELVSWIDDPLMVYSPIKWPGEIKQYKWNVLNVAIFSILSFGNLLKFLNVHKPSDMPPDNKWSHSEFVLKITLLTDFKKR